VNEGKQQGVFFRQLLSFSSSVSAASVGPKSL